jgi:alpha-beta hydrolase superfamily lysophospholipase
MSLEILYTHARGKPKSVDIMLVHGICGGAWIWQDTFMPYLSDAGYNVHAVSLRGHGNSCGMDRLYGLTLGDYTADLHEAAATIRRPLVAVGHSMGGAVVQNAIASGVRFAGAALVASVPPNGLMAANLAMMWHRPALWRELSTMFTSGMSRVNMEVLRDGLFSNRVDTATFDAFAARGGQESPIVGFELQGLRPFAPMPWLAPPMLVMGGTDDRFIRKEDLWTTASWYGTSAQLLPNLSHTVMLDPDWKIAANTLLGWLEDLGTRQTH